MDTNEIVEKVVSAVQEAPEKAQELIADPEGAVKAIIGDVEGFDIHEVIQGVMSKASELGLDFSHVDLSALDLSKLDISKLDLGALKDAAGKLNVDISKLDLSGLDFGNAVSSLLGNLGSIFGK
ncbi:hypothetical protein [Paratractidigestivibacter sp.]|uniref:hypothetical protein n=1 Tax=Paratractidigestivibacter sp. TaxID=2847316 RepID=UPI002ABD353D|nr:hypothetical protein [Paratractidigestivibacter sp.]